MPRTVMSVPPLQGGGAATCPLCGHTTSVERVRAQLEARRGGTEDARLVAAVVEDPKKRTRSYRNPAPEDLAAIGAP